MTQAQTIHLIQHEHFTLMNSERTMFPLLEALPKQDCHLFGLTTVEMQPFFYALLLRRESPEVNEMLNFIVALKMPLIADNTTAKLNLSETCRNALFPVKSVKMGFKSLTLKALAATWVTFAVCIGISAVVFFGERCVAQSSKQTKGKTRENTKEVRIRSFSFNVINYNDAFLGRFHELLDDSEYQIVMKK